MKKHYRLRGRFNRVLSGTRVFTGKGIAVYLTTRQGRIGRIGITCSRQIKGAVNRNRAKRRLREAFRRLERRIRTHGDLVLVARPPVLTAPFDAIVSEMEALCAAGHMLAGGSPHEANG